MTYASYDITIREGAIFHLELIHIDDVTGHPKPLANYNAVMRIVRTTPNPFHVRNDSATHANITLEPGSSTGQINVYLGATATAEFQQRGSYQLDLLSKTDPDDIIPVMRGAVHIERKISS